jgi:hypothetical protein
MGKEILPLMAHMLDSMYPGGKLITWSLMKIAHFQTGGVAQW